MTLQEEQRLYDSVNMRIPGTKTSAGRTLVELVKAMDAYVDAVIEVLPKEGSYTEEKGFTFRVVHERAPIFDKMMRCSCGEYHAFEKDQYSTPREVSAIEREFRRIVGSAAVNALLDDEALWLAIAAGQDPFGEGSPLYEGRLFMADKAAEWAYADAKKKWDANFARFGAEWAQEFPITPVRMPITADLPWLQKLNREGYARVVDKIKLQYLPDIKASINKQAIDGVPWNDIAKNLRREFKVGKRWDWERLVRTEYSIAGSKATLEQYEAAGVPFVTWSTSRGGDPCDACQGYDQKTYITRDMNVRNQEDNWDKPTPEGMKDIPAIPQHPNCRCVLLSSWGKKKLPRSKRGQEVPPSEA